MIPEQQRTLAHVTELKAELDRLESLLARHQIKSTGMWWRLSNARERYALALAEAAA